MYQLYQEGFLLPQFKIHNIQTQMIHLNQGDPTTTTTIPYVPGTTPVGPDGQTVDTEKPSA